MERFTVLDCIAPYHLTQKRWGRWPVGCLFLTFTISAKLQLQTESTNPAGFESGTGQQLTRGL